MSTQQVIPETEALEKQQPTPMRLIELAVSQGADIEKLQKLFELQLRWEENEAKKAFVVAMAAFKKNPPEILKNKTVAYKEVKYSYATLDQVCSQVITALSEHGISHRWEVKQDSSKDFMRIKVTCILTHSMGHSERTELEGPPDTSGSKNAIQAIASTVSYLERYTLLAAVGLATEGQDDDGQGGAPKYADLKERLEWIANSNADELFRIYKTAYAEAEKVGDQDAMKAIIAAKDKRKAELK